MKKLLVLLFIPAFMAACSNNNDKTENKDTSTVVTQDTAKVVTDTTVTRDTINKDDNH